jgi:hypothetical protein
MSDSSVSSAAVPILGTNQAAEVPITVPTAVVHTKRLPRISVELKKQLYTILKTKVELQQYHRGDQKKLAAEHNVSDRTIRRIERDVALSKNGSLPNYFNNKITSSRKYTTKLSSAEVDALLEAHHVNERSSSYDVAAILGVSHQTVRNYTTGKNLKNNVKIITTKNLHVRPSLNNTHLTNRINFIKGKIIDPTKKNNFEIDAAVELDLPVESVLPFVPPTTPYYSPQYDTIHIDEKYFYLNRLNRKVYLSSNEKDNVHRGESVQHKSHRTKCMFLVAVARPRLSRAGTKVSIESNTIIDLNHPLFSGDDLFDDGVRGTGTKAQLAQLSNYHKEVYEKDFLYDGVKTCNTKMFSFDGLVSLIPIVTTRQQKRKSKLHDVGEIIWEPVSMDQQVFEDKFLNFLLPDIKKNCPKDMTSNIITIQMDNAGPHKIGMEKLKEKCLELNLKIKLDYQPAQSPDLNVLDLGFFRSIQSMFWKRSGMEDINHMYCALQDCWETYPPYKLNNAFITLFNNYNSILESNGDNNYKIKHISKNKLVRMGKLPIFIEVTTHINNATNFGTMVDSTTTINTSTLIDDTDWNLEIDDESSTSSESVQSDAKVPAIVPAPAIPNQYPIYEVGQNDALHIDCSTSDSEEVRIVEI